MTLPDLDNLTDDEQKIADRLHGIVHSINATGLHFVLVASSEAVLSHLAASDPDRQAIADRLHEIADAYAAAG